MSKRPSVDIWTGKRAASQRLASRNSRGALCRARSALPHSPTEPR
jgi:hypothetical protein